MIDWQPMDTVPKDGTWVLGINNRGNCAVIIWTETAAVCVSRQPNGDQNYKFSPGWIHPFSLGERSEFWNGACGSVPIAWANLPQGEAAREVVERFSKKQTV